MNLEEYERIQPNAEVDGIKFYLPNRHCEWRVQTIYSKEPDTVAWIRSMQEGEVFFDIGANIANSRFGGLQLPARNRSLPLPTLQHLVVVVVRRQDFGADSAVVADSGQHGRGLGVDQNRAGCTDVSH